MQSISNSQPTITSLLPPGLQISNPLEVVVALGEPVLLPLHPLQLVVVELALQVTIQPHHGVGLLLQLLQPAQLALKLIDLRVLFIVVEGEFLYAFVHLIDDLLVHLALLGQHIQLYPHFLQLPHLLLDCPSQIVEGFRGGAQVLLRAPRVLEGRADGGLLLEFLQLSPEALILLAEGHILFEDDLELIFQLFVAPLKRKGGLGGVGVGQFLLGLVGGEEGGGRLVGADAHGERNVLGGVCVGHHVFGGVGTLEVVDWFVLGLTDLLTHRGSLDIIFINGTQALNSNVPKIRSKRRTSCLVAGEGFNFLFVFGVMEGRWDG